MKQYKNPKWWTTEHDSAWERTKAALKRDWDQTKHDFGGDEPDTDQDVGDTMKQAAGKAPIPPRGVSADDIEAGQRFGYGAQLHYGGIYPNWNTDLENRLHTDWSELHPTRISHWEDDRRAIRHGWDFNSAAGVSDDDLAESAKQRH